MPSFVPPPLSAADYEAIEGAVMETSRGRWFLAEYARRHRHADTGMLLTALERLENVVRDSVGVRTPAAAAGDLSMTAQSDVAEAPPSQAEMPAPPHVIVDAGVESHMLRDPLAPLASMSYEEKIALFT